MKQRSSKKNKSSDSKFATVKISRTSLEKLQANKKKTGVPISVYIDQMVEERHPSI